MPFPMKPGIEAANRSRVIRIAVKRADEDIILLYRLTRDGAPDRLSPFMYSLTVTKVDCGGERRDVRHISDISRNLAEADRIFRLISCGCVTPCCALEVIGDLISI